MVFSQTVSINRTIRFQCGAPAANKNARHPAKARYPGQREITQPGGRNYLCKCDLSGHEMEMEICCLSRLDMGVAEFKSARRWKNKSHSPPRRSSSESNLVFQSEVT